MDSENFKENFKNEEDESDFLLSFFLNFSDLSNSSLVSERDFLSIFKDYPFSFTKEIMDGKDLRFISNLSRFDFDFNGESLYKIFSQKKSRITFERKSSFLGGRAFFKGGLVFEVL